MQSQILSAHCQLYQREDVSDSIHEWCDINDIGGVCGKCEMWQGGVDLRSSLLNSTLIEAPNVDAPAFFPANMCYNVLLNSTFWC